MSKGKRSSCSPVSGEAARSCEVLHCVFRHSSDAVFLFFFSVGDGASVSPSHPLVHLTSQLASRLGVTILRKGSIDVMSDGTVACIAATRGCPRRVGGQGDMLAGAAGTFVAWTRLATDEKERKRLKLPVVQLPVDRPIVFAAYAAATFCRKLQHAAFARHGRSMLASHLLDVLPAVLQESFPIDGVTMPNKL
jgi:NAD(P)H-hydrate repair Nnr-like enzyme with NAD(P)H-hydrate dehydratase domain